MYLYYAIFEEEGNAFNVAFPDLQGAFTFGENMHEALYMAKDLLGGYLSILEDDKEPIPAPSKPSEIKLEKGQLLIPIEVDVQLFREKEEMKLIKKTINIPNYLNRLGKEKGLNFSQVMTEALHQKLEA